jgi:tryptophan halogenase
MPIAGDAVVTELRPGAQQAPWIGNCVAIGGAAMSVDPVHAAELHVTHGCVSHLISLFPATSGHFPEAQAYNSAIRSFGFNLRDFQAAHYLLNRRFDENFWDKVRDAPLPPSLARKSGMFAARAIVPLNDHESFNEQSWAALLTGCGLTPRGYDPRLEGISNEEHVRKVQQRLRSVAMLARQMPNVEEFLGLHQHSAAQVRQ